MICISNFLITNSLPKFKYLFNDFQLFLKKNRNAAMITIPLIIVIVKLRVIIDKNNRRNERDNVRDV